MLPYPGSACAAGPLSEDAARSRFTQDAEGIMATRTFGNLFLDQLKDLYDAEKRITKALPKMVRAARSEELSDALQQHLDETEGQISRLDGIFQEFGKSPGRKACEGMMGLLSEGESMMDESEDEALSDAAIIAAAQKVEHYEIASYGTLREWARLLGRDDVAETLQQSLDEEREADKKLTRLAENLNVQAAERTDGEEMEDGHEMAAAHRESRSTASRGRTGVSAGRSRKH